MFVAKHQHGKINLILLGFCELCMQMMCLNIDSVFLYIFRYIHEKVKMESGGMVLRLNTVI